MSEFNNSKNKFQKIWERIVSNTSEIEIRENSNNPQFFINLLRQQNIKAPIEVYNSGDILLTTSHIFNIISTTKGTVLPSLASYSQSINIEIPEVFLPFVKYSVEVKALPDTEAHVLYQPEVSTWVGDNIEIRGDGKLIYKDNIDIGATTPFNIGNLDGNFIFSNAFFSENNINLDMTKKVWKGVFTVPGNVFGNVTKIRSTVLLAEGTGNCSGSFNNEVFIVDLVNKPNHKIISLTSTSYTAIGDFTETTIIDNGTSCDFASVVTQNIQKSFSFSAVDSYAFQLANGQSVSKNDIITKSFSENGRWLFWSNLLQKLFVLAVTDITEGDFTEVDLSNLPIEDTGDPTSDVLPYTSITLKRNLIPTPRPEIEKTLDIVKSNRFYKNYVKTSPSIAAIPSYRFTLEGEFFINSPAIKLDSIIQFPVYNDIYTQVESQSFPGVFSYQPTTENHSLLEKELWTSESQDVILNIKAYLVNPLYWREQRVYKNGL